MSNNLTKLGVKTFKKRLTEAQQAHDRYAQNTHKKATMRSVVRVQSLLLDNHGNNLVDRPLETMVNDLIDLGLVEEANRAAYLDRLEHVSDTANSQFDKVEFYDDKSQSVKTRTFTIRELMAHLITALYDDEKFIHPEYDLEARLRAFHGVIDEIFKNQCSAGIRNLLIKRTLHDEYQSVFIIDELLTSLTQFTQHYYAEKLARLPEHEEYLIYNQFIRANQLSHDIETPALDALFEDEESLRNYLEDCLKTRGIEVADDKKVTEALTEMLALRFYIQPPMPRHLQVSLAALATYWEQHEALPLSIHEVFKSCRTLADLKKWNISVIMRLIPLRDVVEKYINICPFTSEEKRLKQTATTIFNKIEKYLTASTQNHSQVTAMIAKDEARFSAALQQYRKNIPVLIRDGFALLKCTSKNRKENLRLFLSLVQTYKNHCKMNISDSALREWLRQHVTLERQNVVKQDEHGNDIAVEEQTNTIELTPESVTRFIMHAIITSPAEWTITFKHIMRTVIIPLISNANDDLHAQVIKSSFPPVFVEYLRLLLTLADDSGLKIPDYFVEMSLVWLEALLFDQKDKLFRRSLVHRSRQCADIADISEFAIFSYDNESKREFTKRFKKFHPALNRFDFDSMIRRLRYVNTHQVVRFITSPRILYFYKGYELLSALLSEKQLLSFSLDKLDDLFHKGDGILFGKYLRTLTPQARWQVLNAASKETIESMIVQLYRFFDHQQLLKLIIKFNHSDPFVALSKYKERLRSERFEKLCLLKEVTSTVNDLERLCKILRQFHHSERALNFCKATGDFIEPLTSEQADFVYKNLGEVGFKAFAEWYLTRFPSVDSMLTIYRSAAADTSSAKSVVEHSRLITSTAELLSVMKFFFWDDGDLVKLLFNTCSHIKNAADCIAVLELLPKKSRKSVADMIVIYWSDEEDIEFIREKQKVVSYLLDDVSHSRKPQHHASLHGFFANKDAQQANADVMQTTEQDMPSQLTPQSH